MRRSSWSLLHLGLLALLAGCSTPAGARSSPVPFNVGLVKQRPGDVIKVIEVLGDDPALKVGGHYVLKGAYTLASRDQAILALWCANGDVEPLQREIPVRKGSGEFQFDFCIRSAGYLHLGYYPKEGGDAFASTYFGQDPWVFRPD